MKAQAKIKPGDVCSVCGATVRRVPVSEAGIDEVEHGVASGCAAARGSMGRRSSLRPDLSSASNEEAFAGGWFHTGDLGRADEQGYTAIVDRKKDMIVTGGENVYSKEVEDVIYGVPASPRRRSSASRPPLGRERHRRGRHGAGRVGDRGRHRRRLSGRARRLQEAEAGCSSSTSCRATPAARSSSASSANASADAMAATALPPPRRRGPASADQIGDGVEVVEVGEVEDLEVQPLGAGVLPSAPASRGPRRACRRRRCLRSSSGSRPIAAARRADLGVVGAQAQDLRRRVRDRRRVAVDRLARLGDELLLLDEPLDRGERQVVLGAVAGGQRRRPLRSAAADDDRHAAVLRPAWAAPASR